LLPNRLVRPRVCTAHPSAGVSVRGGREGAAAAAGGAVVRGSGGAVVRGSGGAVVRG
jgi:hypothetical protein